MDLRQWQILQCNGHPHQYPTLCLIFPNHWLWLSRFFHP
ncbi:hypothetical protein EVA_19312 [gut metagenome]|uniref:Uncharacterized protein n=1 Tax=gut metagenome TaxID=749906 RepID=J9FCI3_9ZZZZ